MPDSELLTESPADIALQDAIRTESAPPEPEKAPETLAPEPNTVSDKPNTVSAPPEPPKPPARTVPLESLHEERQKRQALERELAELRRPPADELDETQDPIGTIGKLKQEINSFKQAQAQQAEEAELGRQIATRIGSYMKENPDYPAQYQFLQASRVNELRALGHNEQSIAQQIRFEEMQLGRTALQNDLDPGAVIAQLAAARGWQKPAPTPSADPVPPAPLAPPVAPAAAPAPDTKAADERVERLARGQRAAATSSASGGRATAANDLSIEDIVNLDGAAFDSATTAFFKREKAAGNWS